MAVALLIAVAVEGAILGLCLWIWLRPETAPAVEKAVTKRVPVAVMFQGAARTQSAAVVVETPPPVARKKVKVVAQLSPDPEVQLTAPEVVERPPVTEEAPSEAVAAAETGSGKGSGSGDAVEETAGGGLAEGGTLEGRDLSRYAVLVLSELTANRRVPLQASRMRLQGSAVLELRIGTHGELEQVTLVRSSGHTVLDDAALQTVRDSAPFPAPPGNLLARFTVPIRYVE